MLVKAFDVYSRNWPESLGGMGQIPVLEVKISGPANTYKKRGGGMN